MPTPRILAEMRPEEVLPVRILIGDAMNADEGTWAETTIQRHFTLSQLGISDGRHYFVCREGAEVAGIVGLHHYEWGPKPNVWLGWFAVAPRFQAQGIGKSMLGLIQEEARRLGYRKLFIETYSSPTFARAREFYLRQGFARVGGVDGYLDDGSAMVVFSRNLDAP